MVTNFQIEGFPSYEEIDESGQAKPCVYGVNWVNPDTIRTLVRHGGKPTGPKGEAIEDPKAYRRG
jgi:hypothetical protein